MFFLTRVDVMDLTDIKVFRYITIFGKGRTLVLIQSFFTLGGQNQDLTHFKNTIQKIASICLIVM